MSMQRTWSRLMKRTREKSVDQVRSASSRGFFQKVAAGVAGLGFLATANVAVGSTISAHDPATTVTQSGNTFTITTTKKSGDNAFNSFNQFNLSANDIAQMHLPNSTSNLINFVKGQITIDGMVNAIKNNKIGGNLYFLSAQGLVIGSGGVVNCGAFYAITPTQDFMDKFLKTDTLLITGNDAEIGHITSRKFVNHNGVMDTEGIPINSAGTITISGKVNSIDNVGAYAGQTTLNAGAVLKTGITDFAAIVNVGDLPPGTGRSGLSMTSSEDGNVELVAIADNADEESSITKDGTGYTTFTKAVSDAKVTVNGKVEAYRDAIIEAVAVNGILDSTESVVEYGETRTVEKYTSAKHLSEINATVEIGATANISADNDVAANAVAKNSYKSTPGAADLGLSAMGMISPLNLQGSAAVASTKAVVTVAQGAIVSAKNDLKLNAVAKSDIIVGASTSLAKIRQTPSSLSAGGVFADVTSEANVTVDGSLTAGTSGDLSKGTISVNAESMNYLDGTAAAKTANDNAILCTGAILANVRNNANVRLSNTASLKAQKSVTVKSNTVSDVSTVAIAETGDASYAGAAVNVTEFSSDANNSIGSNITNVDGNAVAGNIDISANNLILQNRSTAESSVGYTKISQALANVESNFIASLFSLSKFTKKFTGPLDAMGSKFKTAGAIVYSQGTHGSKVDIGSNVKITAGDKLILKSSTIVQDLFMQADSVARSKMTKADGTKVSVSAGINYTDISQTSCVQIADATKNATTGNDTVLTGKSVEIDSSTKIEYNRVKRMIQAVEDAIAQLKISVSDPEQLALVNGVEAAYATIKAKFSAIGADGLTTAENISAFGSALSSLTSMAGVLGTLVSDEVGVVAQAAKIVTNAADFAYYNNFLNVYAASAIKGATGDNSQDIGFAGTVGLNDFTPKSDVIVGRNVTLKSQGAGPEIDKTIDITTNTSVDIINGAGHLIPSTGAKSFGGVYDSQEFRSSSNVMIAEGAILQGNEKDISISAANDARTTVIGASTALAGSGLEGMVARVVGVSNASVYIDDEVQIDGKNIDLTSYNNTNALTVAGAVMISSEIGVAAGIAINDFEKHSTVFVGDIDERYQDTLDEQSGVDKTTTTNSLMNVTDKHITATGTGKITAQAKSSGGFIAVGVAGGVTKNDDSGIDGRLTKIMQGYDALESKIAGTINALGSKFTNITGQLSSKTSNSSSGTHQNPSLSLSAAGSLGLNIINSSTNVDISGTTLNLAGNAGSNLNVSAINCSDAQAFGGSAGLMWQTSTSGSGKSVGIAGAVGLNSITNTTGAIVQNCDIKNADDVNIFAVNGGSDIAAGLGLQMAKNNGNADGAYTMGGSVSINDIDNTVTSTLKDTDVTGKSTLKTDVNVAAYEGDLQITGGVQLTIGKEKGAFGAAVNVSDIANTVTGKIENGTFLDVKDVSTSALQALTQVSGALTAGIIWGTDNTTAIMGALIYNRLRNDLTSVIKGATITAAGTVSANTRDYRTGNTVSGFESLLERSNSGVESFISTDGTDYYDVDASNDTETTSTPLKDQVKNGALIVTGAMAISAADNAAGAAVVINDITNTFDSKIDSGEITAGTIKTDAQAASFLVTAAGGAAVSTKNGAGGGSMVWNGINNTVNSGSVNSTLTAKKISEKALNGIRMISVAGQIAAGKGSAVGLAATVNDILNNTLAYSYATTIHGLNTIDSELLVEAESNADVLDISASVAAGENLGIGGSVAINKLTNNTKALVDNTYTDENNVTHICFGKILDKLQNTNIHAKDGSVIKSLAGTVAAGGKAGIGGSVAYNEISGTTDSAISNVALSTVNGTVKTENAAEIWTLAAGIGGGGTVAVQGAAATGDISRTISARMHDVHVDKPGSSLDVTSDSTGAIRSSAAVLAVGGKAAVGAGVSVNRIDDTVSASVTGGTLTLKDLEIRSKASQVIQTIGAAGSGGASFGVSGSVGFNKIETTNNAFIDGGAVITAADNIGVVAQTDDTLMNYAGVLAIGGSAGVGAAVAINYILGDTKAYIDNATLKADGTAGGVTANNGISDDDMNSGFISDQSVNILYTLENQRTSSTKTGIVVDSSATHTMKSFVANAAGAGAAALAGTVNVNQIDGNTNAYIKNATLNLSDKRCDVTVNAADYTNCSGFVGSVGGAGTLGIGASSDTNKVRRNTSAKLENIISGSRAKAAVVNAIAKQGISSVAAGLGIGGIAGIAGTVSVAMLSGTTEAVVNNSLLTADSLTVNAEHWAKTSVLDATAGLSEYLGIGGGVAVNDIRDTVKAEVIDSTIQTTTDGVGAIQVKAKNCALLTATAACLGGGMAGIAGNVSVNYMQNEVTVSVKNSSLGTSGKRADSIVIKAENSSTIDSKIGVVAVGAIAAGASVGVNTLDGKVRTVVDGSNLYAKNNIDIAADETRTVTQVAFTAAGGLLGFAGNVMYLSAGQVLSATNEDGNKEIRDAITSAELVNNGSIGSTNGALTDDEQSSLNGTSNNLSAQETGKSATTVSVGRFEAANASVIDSSAGAVSITSTENTNTTMTGGSGAAGACAAGGSVGIADVNRNVGTTVANATVNAGGAISVTSEAKGSTNLNMYQGSLGAFAAGTAAYGRIGASGNALTAVSNSTMKNGGTITIGAKDTTGANADSRGLTIGFAAAGILVTQIDNNGAANVNLGVNTFETSSGIDVKAEKENSLSAKTVGGTYGITVSGTGIAATVNDTGNAAVTMTGNGSSFTGTGITFTASNKPTAVSEASSAAVSGLVSAGVSVANSTLSGKALVNVSGGNVFNAPTVSFNGTFSGTNTAKAVGVSGGFVGSFGYNESYAYNNALVNVIIGNNTYDAATDLQLHGSNIVTQSAETNGLNVGGLIASGNNKARTEADTTTKVQLTGDATTAKAVHSIDILADSSSTHTAKADGNGGGLVSVDGLSAYAINSITTNTEAVIGGKWSIADTLKLFANQYDRASLNADSTRGTLVGYSGTKAENTISSVTKTNVQDNAQIEAGSDVEFQAKNTISTGDEDGFSASGAGYGGITVNGAASTLTVTSTTEAKVGSNAKITAKGNITGNAMTDATLINKVRAVGAGVVANPEAVSDNTITISNSLTTGAGSLLKTTVAGKNVNLAASTKLTAKLTSDSDMQGGLGGDSHAKTISHITKNNTLDLYGDLFSTNDINLYTDADANGKRSVYNLTATADSYNKNSVVAVAKAELDSWTHQSNGINIYAGSDVQSVRHINLHATPGKEVMTEAASEYTWYSTDVTGGYASTASGQRSNNITSNNYVNIGGSLVAGIYNKVNLTFDGTVDFLGAVTNSVAAPTITSTVEDYKKGVTYGTTNYANDLFTRYQEVCRLAVEYAGSKAGIGYEAEKERLLGEMEKYGLYDSSTGLVIGGMTVQYIALPDMVCSGGNVVIDTDGVVGNGSVNAKGSPEINITNNTNLYMKVNDLAIADYGGEVILNGLSLGNTAATKLPTLSSVSTSDSSSALISVKETWNGNLQVTSGGRTEYRTPLTTIEVNGDISNPLGKVSIDDTKGDIVIQGKTAQEGASIQGREVELKASAGSISQGYTQGIVNIGATPEYLYKSFGDTAAAAIDGHEESDTERQTTYNTIDESLQNGTWIAGGSVFINASDININGLIQSGYAEYKITLSTDAQNKIDQYDYYYYGQNITPDALRNYKLNDGGAKYVGGVYTYEVQAFYNPQTKQIILEDVDPQGGKIYLTGRISSTGNGRLVAADGSANISITNGTDKAITVGKVNVGDLDGAIKITDTEKNTVTELRRDSTTTSAIGSTVKTVSGPSSVYSPKSGLYYNWSTGYEQTTYEHYGYSQGFSWWGGYTWNAGTISEKETLTNRLEYRNGSSNKLQGTYVGTPTGASGEYTIFYKNDVGYNNPWYNNWISYDNWTHFSGTEYYDWGKNVGKVVTFQHSLNASHDIGVSFIGSTSGGSVNLTSAGDVNLTGNVTGVTGTAINITSSNGAISQTGGTIIGNDITLSANTGIGNTGSVYQQVLGDSGTLKATTNTGNVDIRSFASIGKQGNLLLTATTNSGNVKIDADGSILQSGSGVSAKGDRIDLLSRNGSIGQPGNSLLVQAGQTPVNSGDTMSASLNAHARGDVDMTQSSGDMRLGRVESDLGDVNLVVSNGSFNNVLPATEDSSTRKGDDLVAKWVAMGLINADGSDNGAQVKSRAIENYENGVKSEFANYLAQKAIYDANPDILFRAD